VNGSLLREGVALLCSRAGVIQDVIRDDFGLTASRVVAGETRFEALFEPSSREKAVMFIQRVE